MMKRFRSGKRARMLLAAVLLGLVGVFSSVNSVAAAPLMGCGWPSCNPARLSSSASKWITPPGGTSAYIIASFSSSVSYPLAETSATFSGSSSTTWNGSNPLRAAHVDLTDKWTASGIGISVSFPSGSVGFSGSGSAATWTGGVDNTWQVYHSFSGIKFTGLDIAYVTESATGTFRFGSAFFTVAANDSAPI